MGTYSRIAGQARDFASWCALSLANLLARVFQNLSPEQKRPRRSASDLSRFLTQVNILATMGHRNSMFVCFRKCLFEAAWIDIADLADLPHPAPSCTAPQHVGAALQPSPFTHVLLTELAFKDDVENTSNSSND